MPPQEYDRGGQEKIKQTNKHEQSLGLTKSRRRYATLHSVCGLSLAWVTSENSTSTGMPTSFDSIFFAVVGPSLLCYCLQSPVLTAPVRGSTPTLCCPVANSSRPGPVVNSCQLLFPANSHCLLSRLSAVRSPAALVRVPSSTPFRVPLPLPDTARFQVQKSFVWFRAETDKGIVCSGHPYSATYLKYYSCC